ncbi:hypothetical protein KPH14_005099 [Odynerus spinipes]|uniref:Microsomal glutathione S-transferase 1 n=1 Tax=Odynerus spinipes TaxID=1348599 RepID=A0AAD9RKI9_9HYME|nr:hypothetical protein KPH14_005099 [Odynerus spinipes]
MMAPVNTEILKLFGFWSSILVIKMMLMILLTAYQRFTKKIFANPEDASLMPKAKVSLEDPDVERVRRAHLNDLENIVPWFIITYVWLMTGPSVWLAGVLIRTFAITRIIHTLVYAVFPQQPARFLCFAVGYVVITYEALVSLLYYL